MSMRHKVTRENMVMLAETIQSMLEGLTYTYESIATELTHGVRLVELSNGRAFTYQDRPDWACVTMQDTLNCWQFAPGSEIEFNTNDDGTLRQIVVKYLSGSNKVGFRLISVDGIAQ